MKDNSKDMNKNKYCVIMAGGVGSRFWPVSRADKPKQFLDMLGTGKSFIRHTFERFLSLVPAENFFVVTSAHYKDLVAKQLPEIPANQILLEPVGRNTAPCVAYAAFRVKALNPDAEMIVTPADHLVLMHNEFCQAICEGLDYLKDRDALMTIGIKPTRPDTGYGYIQVEDANCISKVKTFTEKPKREMAQIFMDSGEFMWNAGIFIWRADAILNALEQHQNEIYSLFHSVLPYYNTAEEQQHIDKVYSQCRAVSIDIGVMERATNVFVRPSEFGWSDIGTWVSLYQNSTKDTCGNVAPQNFMAYDTHNCMVRSKDDKLVVIQGLSDYIVVDTKDVLMICPKKNEQNIKQFVDDVRFNDKKEYI